VYESCGSDKWYHHKQYLFVVLYGNLPVFKCYKVMIGKRMPDVKGLVEGFAPPFRVL